MFVIILLLVYEKSTDKDGFIEGLVKAINDLPYDKNKADVIKKICFPFASKLMDISKKENLNSSQQEILDMEAVQYMSKMTLIIRSLDPVDKKEQKEISMMENGKQEHVMVGIFREMWPLIEKLLQKYAVKKNLKKENYHVIEKLCRLVKATMRCIRHQFSEFTNPYFKIIIANYEVRKKLF